MSDTETVDRRQAPWWPEARRLLDGGASYAEAGAAVGVTARAVRDAARRRGLARDSRRAAWRPEAERMLRAGATYAEVGQAVGVTPQAVHRAAKRWGLAPRRR